MKSGPTMNQYNRMRNRAGDAALWLGGFALAAASMGFPWYVYLHPDNFSPPRIEYSGNSELYGEPEDRPSAFVSRLYSRSGTILDPIETGSVAPAANENAATAAQPFPGRASAYRLVHVANGRALVRDDTGIFMVRLNSSLPDGQKVNEFRRGENGWELITSGNQVVSADP